MYKQKKKAGIVSDLVGGAGNLVILVVVIGVIVATILGAGLLTTGSTWDNVTSNMESNFTAGIDNVNTKLPTILLIAAVVLLFGVIVVLVAQTKRMGISGGGL